MASRSSRSSKRAPSQRASARRPSPKKPKPAVKPTPVPRAVAAGLASLEHEPVPDLFFTGPQEFPRSRRKWDPDKVVDYVCEKISHGAVITHVLRHIGIGFITFLEYAEDDPARAKRYAKARKAEAKAVAALARDASNGIDPISAMWRGRIEAIYAAILQTKAEGVRANMALVVRAEERIRELEKNLIARNRLQMDTLKWYARITDPEVFGDKSMPNSPPPADAISVRVEFVEPTTAPVAVSVLVPTVPAPTEEPS